MRLTKSKPSPKLIELANQVRAGADLDWLVLVEGLDSSQKSRIKDLAAPHRYKRKGIYSSKERAALLRLHAQGIDAAQIALELGRSERSVTRYLHTQKLVASAPTQQGIRQGRVWCREQLGLVVETRSSTACVPPPDARCQPPSPSLPLKRAVRAERPCLVKEQAKAVEVIEVVEELLIEEAWAPVIGPEQWQSAQLVVHVELVGQAAPLAPKKEPRSVSSRRTSRLESKRGKTRKIKMMRKDMQHNISEMSAQLVDDLWDTASRYAACGRSDRALWVARIAKGEVRALRWRRMVGQHRELDRVRAEAVQAQLRADLEGVMHARSPSVVEELCSAAAFFAGVEQAEEPLIEVSVRLAKLYAEQSQLKLRQADPNLGDALVRRARLNLGLNTEYTDLDAQHVKRVLERIEGFERPEWTPLDHTIFARFKQLRGSCRI